MGRDHFSQYGDPTPLAWVDKPTLRLAPGEKEKFERRARGEFTPEEKARMSVRREMKD